MPHRRTRHKARNRHTRHATDTTAGRRAGDRTGRDSRRHRRGGHERWDERPSLPLERTLRLLSTSLRGGLGLGGLQREGTHAGTHAETHAARRGLTQHGRGLTRRHTPNTPSLTITTSEDRLRYRTLQVARQAGPSTTAVGAELMPRRQA